MRERKRKRKQESREACAPRLLVFLACPLKFKKGFREGRLEIHSPLQTDVEFVSGVSAIRIVLEVFEPDFRCN